MSSPFKQTFVELGDTFGVLVYDLAAKSLVGDICDYAQELISELSLVRLTVEKEINHLKVFWAYLKSNKVDLEEVTDRHLIAFRDFALLKTQGNPSHRGGIDASKMTVNAKLVRIYDWLLWLRETARIDVKVIGADGQVRSTLRGSSISGLERTSRKYRKARSAYPCLFRLQAGQSKHSVPQSIPSENTVDALHQYFFENAGSDFLAHRNVLLIDVANCTGFRRASIQSLKVEQFIGSDFFVTEHDTVIVRPSRQKFDYSNTFEMPGFLHDQIRKYIQDFWLPFVSSKGYGVDRHKGHVFISARDGRPLDDRSITSLISKGMRAQGFKKGAALHVFRAKFTKDEVAEEYTSRKKLDLDTSTESVKLAVSSKTGHRDPESLRAYTSKYESTEVARRRSKDLRDREQDKKRIADLEAEVLALRGLTEAK